MNQRLLDVSSGKCFADAAVVNGRIKSFQKDWDILRLLEFLKSPVFL